MAAQRPRVVKVTAISKAGPHALQIATFGWLFCGLFADSIRFMQHAARRVLCAGGSPNLKGMSASELTLGKGTQLRVTSCEEQNRWLGTGGAVGFRNSQLAVSLPEAGLPEGAPAVRKRWLAT